MFEIRSAVDVSNLDRYLKCERSSRLDEPLAKHFERPDSDRSLYLIRPAVEKSYLKMHECISVTAFRNKVIVGTPGSAFAIVNVDSGGVRQKFMESRK